MKKIFKFALLFVFLSFVFSCAPKPAEYEEKRIQNSQYYYKIGLSYLNSGNIAQAIYYLNKAYEIDPEDPDILNALGIAYTNVKEYSRAKEFFLKSIEILPDKPETYTNLGVLLAQEGNYEQALWYLEKAIENPNYRNKEKALYNIAVVYRKMGNLPKFEEALKRTISYNPYFMNAYITLGNYYILQKRYTDAYDIFTRAVNAGLVNPYIYLGLGKAYYYLGEYEKSRYFFQKAKKVAGDDMFVKQEAVKFIDIVDRKIVEKKEREIKEQSVKKKVSVKRVVKKEIRKEDKVVETLDTGKDLSEPEKKEESPVMEEKKPEKEKSENERVKIGGERDTKVAKRSVPETPKKVIKPKIRFYVQVGVFSDEKSAMDIYEKLKEKGFEPQIKRRNIDGTEYYFVIIGYFKSYLEASRFYRKNLKPDGFKGIVKFVRK
ncbi:MAG TPA: tetratricopeptide repeat protein [Persephonella sp.]|uniref:TPR Domain containing protein n=1 Tax=Persephonella marina (strain DSM 14350 / EX-H1) TaxID=123214 RepID=C0QPI9_PERMH|nr:MULTISPECIES: tetratricopeptide repeat protein [Persephonella]ACO04435.1 TPR Domain containing protein [Persephonella marina EX-H1]HCB69800.1 tetratricopeptide repeat protein [Persephonella sp.]